MGRKLNGLQVKDIVDKYLSGEDVESLATSFSVSKSTVWSHLRKLNVISKTKKGNPTFTQQELLNFAEENKKGKSIREIAKEKGIPYATLQKNLKRVDIKPIKKSGRTEKLSASQITEICSKYEDGLSSIELGKRYNVSRDTILKYLKENNVIINSPGMKKNDSRNTNNKFSLSQLEKFHLQYRQGVSIEVLAKENNVSGSYLRQEFKKNNLLISNKKLTDKQKREIVKKYIAGNNSIDLAEEYKVSHTLINEILNLKSVDKHRHSSKTIKSNKSKLNHNVK